MRPRKLILGVLALCVAAPSEAHISEVHSIKLPKFSELNKDAFSTNRRSRFLAFEQKTQKPPQNEYRRLRTMPCGLARRFGYAQAMVRAIQMSQTSAAATKLYDHADRLWHDAKERSFIASRSHKYQSPHQIGKELLRRAEIDQIWQSVITSEITTPDAGEVFAWRGRPDTCMLMFENTEFLKGVLSSEGWPSISKYGRRVSEAAWIIAQHSDADVPFQKFALNLLKPLAAKGEVDRSDFAKLTDRIEIAQSRLQIYGTQYEDLPGGCMTLRATIDPAHLDARRKELGLEPVSISSPLIAANYHKSICH